MKTTNCIKNHADPLKKKTFSKLFLVGILSLLIVCTAILSWVPPVSRDALTHHLAVPKLYLQHGGMYEIPSIMFSYYPMNLDLLYTIPLYFGNDIVPKFIHFMFALLTAWLVYAYLARRLGVNWAIFGSSFFLSLPVIVKLSITVYVDLGLIFFSTAALISLFKWIENRFQVRFLIVSAICCGLALGTKYNGLIVFFILTVFTPFVFIRDYKTRDSTKAAAETAPLVKIQLKAVGFAALFISVAMLVFSPWMIRNYVWKENPIYPLYDSIFNRHSAVSPDAQSGHQPPGPIVDPQNSSEVKSSRWGSFAIRKVIYGESWWEIALVPVRIFFQGRDNSPKHFDGKLSPFLLLLPFFAFFQTNHHSAPLRIEKKFLLFFAILFILYAFSMTSIRIRYIAPIIPPLVILSIFGFHNIVSALANRWKQIPQWLSKSSILLIGGALLSYNGLYIAQQFNYVQPFSYLSGKMSRDSYIAKYRPEYTIYQYANLNLPENAKILGVFLGNRRYYCDRDLIFGQNEFLEAIQRSNSMDMLIKELQQNGYTHVIVRFDLFNWWTDKQFDEGKKEMLKTFFTAYLEPIRSENGYGLFEFRKI